METHQPAEQLAFLRAIRSTPDDDLPRLVYADWLEEHAGYVEDGTGRVSNGYAARADHIRKSIYAGEEGENGWTLQPHIHHPKAHLFRVGVVDGITGQRGLSLWRRGFIDEFRGPLRSCLDHLPTLVRHPSAVITRVQVTDREPYHSENDWRWHRIAYRSHPQSGLPDAVFDQLVEPIGNGWMWKRYHTRELAESALSAALLTLAWNPVTLPAAVTLSPGTDRTP